MFGVNHQDRRGFTLTEMLVVIGIIAILAALLLPAVNRAIYTARNAAIGVEVNQLATAVESYKQSMGDYPPNFRDVNAVRRHIMKCYPKIDPVYFNYFMNQAMLSSATGAYTGIDEGESLVFWLSMTDNDPRYPFLSYPVKDASGNIYPLGKTPNPKKYYDFDQTRFYSTISDGVPCYKAKFCKDTYYLYIDSRSYDALMSNFPSISNNGTPATVPQFAFGDDATVPEGMARPYWSDNAATLSAPSTYPKDQTKPVNPTTFQILCAGQDGDFGVFDGVNRTPADVTVKLFKSGLNYNPADKDNIANFSEGKILSDNVPAQ